MDEGLTKIRHDRSKKDFPFLKLEDDEYVEFAFTRAKVCLALIFGGLAAGIIFILLAFLIVILNQQYVDEMGRNFMFVILTVLILMAIVISLVALMVYRGNRLFITNKHAIQMVMKSPVATSINMIDLQSIEDASFHQNGVLQKMFHYGTFRLSTVGDETTYTFDYSDINPAELKEVSKLITDAKKKFAQKQD